MASVGVAVIDFATTGLNPDMNRVVEVALGRVNELDAPRAGGRR